MNRRGQNAGRGSMHGWRRRVVGGVASLVLAACAAPPPTPAVAPGAPAAAPSAAVAFARPRDAAMEVFVDSVLALMTLEEKLGQLNQPGGPGPQTGPEARAGSEEEIRAGRIGSFLSVNGAANTLSLQRAAVERSRLGIPLLFAHDVIHGFRTIFPVPLAEAASWDPEAVERAARVAAIEATAHGVHWTYAPMVDIARDPRWGRIVEGSGEGPYLGSAMAVARVHGFQGDDLRAGNTLLATAKHFVAYGAAEAGRDYNTVDLSEQTLRDVYLPPFEAAAGAGVESMMGAFNEVNGVPMHAHEGLINGVLRGEWGWDGILVSDYTGVMELMNGRPLSIPWLEENVPAIVEAWYLGVQMGPAVADVLFGEYSPGGKLPVSFPRNVGQVPLYFNHKNTGRPPSETERYTSKYIDVHWTPLYPFGHGLSYTSFGYSQPRLSAEQMALTDSLTVEVDVTNTDARAGDEVVQLYVRDEAGSVTRPVKELKGFRRITLQPGERQTVRFTLSARDLAFHDEQVRRVVEPGFFTPWVGTSSADERQRARFEVVGEVTEVGR